MARGLSFSPGLARKRAVTATPPSARSLRAIALLIAVTAPLMVCTFRLAQLQLIEGKYNRLLAEDNRVRFVPIPADRGNIFDRNGKLLATNRLTRAVYLWPRQQSPEQWYASAQRLGKILGLEPQEILKKLEEAGFASSLPVRITRDLSPTEFIGLAEFAGQMPGLEIRGEAARNYPNGSVAAHMLGYIGEATADDLKEHPEYPMGMLLGKMGLERTINKVLQGKWGNRLVEVDAAGKERRILGYQSPVGGESVKLTVDIALQKAAEAALGGRRGSVVVLDAKTGAVLTMVSHPTFDPNLFTRKVSASEWEQLQASDNPFLNRSLQGYPPGSTFKIVTSAAAMGSGQFSPDSMLVSSAAITVGGISFHEHGNSGYGLIGFRDALAYSSNTFFYQVGLAIGPEQISKWGKALGIGATDLSLLGLDGGSHGSLPTPKEKQELYDEPWYAGDTVTMSIGQGLALMTPLEMAVMVSAIANGGWRVKPHLLTAQTNTPQTAREKVGLSPEEIAVIREGLIAVVQKGTARQLNDGTIPLTGGKTGTVEVLGQEDNSMYVGFAPANDPKIAISVVIEEGGYGATSAVPVAQAVYRAYFSQKR
ncbi:penicillin-binding protein 2 [Geitlerinema sp. PCC 7407]|uniref:penicillin-binding protein 2 n=1 Tax=Geitlerinema sp. PCC 7407 TaxID=1173025 RepID=UPI00029FE7EC|nr:penicillin-binding protein 2 [Geitlerinema sp. PCC 7407]AFY68149.1 peptidoglycan glycosyltransferase [Geitlerinema sp. PCC 7407]